METYAQANAIEPSSSVKDKIFSQISKDELKDNNNIPSTNFNATKQDGYRIPTFFKLAAAAIIILLIGSIVLNYSYYNKYQSANNKLQVAQEKIKQNEQANLAMKDDIDVMSDKNSLPVVLKGTPHAPDALAKIYWMKNTGEVYVDPTNLPAVPAGKQYQLWAIVDGKPVDAGMISTEKGIYHIQKMKSFGHASFCSTLRKAGGSYSLLWIRCMLFPKSDFANYHNSFYLILVFAIFIIISSFNLLRYNNLFLISLNSFFISQNNCISPLSVALIKRIIGIGFFYRYFQKNRNYYFVKI